MEATGNGQQATGVSPGYCRRCPGKLFSVMSEVLEAYETSCS
jgi:hypothetical protein